MPDSSATQIHRGVAATLAVVAMLWLAACGSSSENSTQTTGAGGSTPAKASSNGASHGGGGKNSAGEASKVSNATRLHAARTGVITLTDCLRGRGIKVPPQQVSGPHPVFSTKGIQTTTPQFRAAYPVCFSKALGAYHAVLQKG